MENPPNQTLYINNLNEKVKKEGKVNSTCSPSSSSNLCTLLSDRTKEVALRHLLPIRTHPRHRSHEDAQDERAGIRGISGRPQFYQQLYVGM